MGCQEGFAAQAVGIRSGRIGNRDDASPQSSRPPAVGYPAAGAGRRAPRRSWYNIFGSSTSHATGYCSNGKLSPFSPRGGPGNGTGIRPQWQLERRQRGNRVAGGSRGQGSQGSASVPALPFWRTSLGEGVIGAGSGEWLSRGMSYRGYGGVR